MPARVGTLGCDQRIEIRGVNAGKKSVFAQQMLFDESTTCQNLSHGFLPYAQSQLKQPGSAS